MKISANGLTTSLLVAPDQNEAPGAQVYRLRKCFAAVRFGAEGTGRIVFLAKGAELRVVGSSHVNGCLEVLCGHQRYHMFKIDLWGPHVESKSPQPSRMQSARDAVAVGVCA